MKVAALLEQRQQHWLELDRLCGQSYRHMDAATVTRFAALYRAACADLALADAYQLPPNTVQYLHQLVGRAHNQLYRSRHLNFSAWGTMLLRDVPRRIFADRCVQLVFVLFWATFLMSATMAYRQIGWADQVLPEGMRVSLEENFKEPMQDRDPQINYAMAAFYIRHNTGIGLRCFAWGILIIPGVRETLNNALVLGAAFGYMGRPDVAEGPNFFNFVTAHGPFELTAIVLAAGAGLRLGMGWLTTHGLTRSASLQKTAAETMPIMGAAMGMFFLAALIEGFLSPTSVDYAIKSAVAIVSSGMLMFYFIFLGFPWKAR
ncbi:MAG: stage II sporulation protein M [Pirellulaceae bacterium]